MKPQENVSFGLKNIMPGTKKLWEEHLFPLEKLFFLPTVEKNNRFSSGNKSSPQSFSVPGIMFPARRNIYSLPIKFITPRFSWFSTLYFQNSLWKKSIPEELPSLYQRDEIKNMLLAAAPPVAIHKLRQRVQRVDILYEGAFIHLPASWVRLPGPVIQANGRLTFEDDLRSGGLLCFNSRNASVRTELADSMVTPGEPGGD